MSVRGAGVLIVEDEALIAFDLADLVSAGGRTVIGPALSIAEAKALLAHHRPDVALLDIDVGGEPVWNLAATLMDQGCGLIFISADTPPGDADFPFRDCIFLSKPGDARLIGQALDDVATRRTISHAG